MPEIKCVLRSTAKNINQDCQGNESEECQTCTRRKSDLNDLSADIMLTNRIGLCDLFTTNPISIRRTCPGKGYDLCMLCTKFKGAVHALEEVKFE